MITEVRGFIRIIDEATSSVAPVRVAVPVPGTDAGLYVHVVSTPGGGGAAFSIVDKTAFVVGVSALVPTGGVFNDALAALAAGLTAETRITSYRALHTNLRDNSGNEIGIIANPLQVDVLNAVTVSGTVAVSGNVTVIQPTGTSLHVVVDSGVITSITNTVVITGTDADNAINSTTKVPTIPALANAAAPAWTEGHEAPLSVDLAGNLRTSVSGTVNIKGLDVTPATQSITTYDINSTKIVQANGQIAYTGTPVTGSIASFSFDSYTSLRIEVTGSDWTGTLQTEASLDSGITWYPIELYQSDKESANSFTENFSGTVNVAAVTNFRVRALPGKQPNDDFTGTATVKIVETINTKVNMPQIKEVGITNFPAIQRVQDFSVADTLLFILEEIRAMNEENGIFSDYN